MSYRFMRLLVLFDLPVKSIQEKRAYRKFRKFLLQEGFLMHQFSVYSKIFLNNTAKTSIIERLKKNAPEKGLITILSITEKQFSRMLYLRGEKIERAGDTDSRLLFLGEEDDLL